MKGLILALVLLGCVVGCGECKADEAAQATQDVDESCYWCRPVVPVYPVVPAYRAAVVPTYHWRRGPFGLGVLPGWRLWAGPPAVVAVP